MKRAGLILVLCAMLILPLTACGSKPADTNGASSADSAKTRTIMAESKQMMLDAKYYAAPNGRVRGMGKDRLSDRVRTATRKVADDILQAGDSMGNAHSDMTRN